MDAIGGDAGKLKGWRASGVVVDAAPSRFMSATTKAAGADTDRKKSSSQARGEIIS